MTILIKGMEMPETCYYCPFSDEDYKGVVMPSCILVGEDMSTYEYRHSRHEHCPLVEVPTPHGRLIEADAIPFVQSEDGCTDDYAYRYDINELPTIIEAEEG